MFNGSISGGNPPSVRSVRRNLRVAAHGGCRILRLADKNCCLECESARKLANPIAIHPCHLTKKLVVSPGIGSVIVMLIQRIEELRAQRESIPPVLSKP